MTTTIREKLAFGFVYALCVLTMGLVGTIVPNIAKYAANFGVAPASIGFAISLFSFPGVVISILGGRLIDRSGIRTAFTVSIALIIFGACCAYAARSIVLFDIALLAAGIGYAGIAVASPAALIATLSGSARVKAMSFLATYPPTGFATGLLIAALFADGANWQMSLALQIVAIVLISPGVLLLAPHAPASARAVSDARQGPVGFARLVAERRVLYLGVTCALPGFISYGTSLIAPSYLAETHGVSIATSSMTVALGKVVVMIAGGLIIGALLARRQGWGKLKLFGALAATGLAAQWLIYFPASSFSLAAFSLFIWLFAFSGMAGIAMAALPDVVSTPDNYGFASGIVNQCIAIASFAAPTVFFGIGNWLAYVALAALALLLGLVGLWASHRPAAEGAAMTT
jgi:MFS family permease